MQLDAYTVSLWIAGFALNVLLLAVLLLRKRYRTVRWFTLLIGQDALQTIILFSVRHHPFINFYTYWTFELLDAALRVLVVWEVARILIEQHLGLRLYDEIRSYWAAFVLMVVVGCSFLVLPANIARFEVRTALRIEELSTIGVGGLLLMVLSLTFLFRVKVRVHAQAIVYGFSLYLFGKFVVQGLVMLLGPGVWSNAEQLLKPVYQVSLLLWIICLWREEPERVLSDEMYRMVKLGRAGIAPPLPKAIMEEQQYGAPRLSFSGPAEPVSSARVAK